MRKQIQAEHGMADLDRKIEELEAEKKRQSEKVIELKSKIEAIETRSQERKDIDQKKRSEENHKLKFQDQHLNKFLKHIADSQKDKV